MPEQYTITQLSPDELKQLIADTVREELDRIVDQIRPEPEDKLITLDDTAKLFGVSHTTIHAWKKAGKFPYYRMSGRVYFKKQEVLDSMKKVDLSKFRNR